MPKRKKRVAPKRKQDNTPSDVSECDSLERPPSAKKVAPASSTSHLEDEMDQVSPFASVTVLNSSRSESGETATLSSWFFCNYCKFTADVKAVLVEHMRQHAIKCPHCSFNSFSRAEVSRHCRLEHDKDLDEVSPEVASSSTDCEMDKDPCSSCVFCSFMTYSTEHLESHTRLKHPGMLPQSVAKMISKQISAEIRRDDALFYLTISNAGPTKSSLGLGYDSADSDRPPGMIVIDPSSGKSEDIKPEVKCSGSSSNLQIKCPKSSEKVHLDGNIHSEKLSVGKNKEKTLTKVDTSIGTSLSVKVETMYCLSCPYSNVYIENLKCHTIAKHPDGAAAATYCSSGDSLDSQDITFFCVRKDCSFSSTDCLSFQGHLMDCCTCWKTLQDLDKDRLQSTITYISKHQKKYKIPPKEGFLDFTSLFLSTQTSLKGILSSAAVERQAKIERSKNVYSSIPTITETAPENLPPTSDINYETSSNQGAVSSSGYQSADPHAKDMKCSIYQQQMHPNTHQPDIISTNQTQVSSSQDPVSFSSMNDGSLLNYNTKITERPTQVNENYYSQSAERPQNHCIQTSERPQQVGPNCAIQTGERPQQVGQNYGISTGERPSQTYSIQTGERPPQQDTYHSQTVQRQPLLNHNYSCQTSHRVIQLNQTVHGAAQTVHRRSQPNQNYSTQSFYRENQEVYPQPSPVQAMRRSYQDSQPNSSWPSSFEAEASIPIQSEQSYKSPYQGNPGEGSSGLVSQGNTVYNPPVNASKLDAVLLVPSQDISLDLMPTPSHNTYAPVSSGAPRFDFGNSNLRNTVNNNLTGDFIEASMDSFTNPVTSHQQQLPVSNNFSLSSINMVNSEIQPQPKIIDIFSSSNPAMLADDFGPQELAGELNNLIQPQTAPVMPPTYHQETAVSSQSLHLPQSSQGLPTSHPSVQLQEPNYQQPVVDNSVMQSLGTKFSFPPTVQGGQISNVRSNLPLEPGFQPAQSSGSYGALRSSLASEESLLVPAMPQQPCAVPNFLGAPGTSSSGAVPTQPAGVLPAKPGMVPPAPFTPPKNSDINSKFAGTSPLSPSIYLSGQAPRHRRSNWTDADMRPRGMVPSPAQLRGMQPSAPGPPSHVNQRLFSPGRRGCPRGGPRISPGRSRMPVPRMLMNRNDDDDDVIITRTVPPINRQPTQQPGERFPSQSYSSPVSRGRGQVFPGPNRGRGRPPGVRLSYPVQLSLPQPQKQLDISKHFEDLACVVNASLEEGGNDDIEIVDVTPGKDRDKGSQPKAVDASKFSFCCVHCGKDQGSKNVMKQHMKARHNDSLLGAFTNVETGQLLFFCPQLTCEFMTYDEKRLCEHLSKCYDLDKSKPFDFGTAIKNLKSLKIRQLDVRTMGRSQDNPIDLDGQGMKDNFSSSLNDAFGDIVVNASGRHIVRNATMSRPTPPVQSQPQPVHGHIEATQGKSAFRNQVPGNFAPRMRFSEQGGGGRMYRPMTYIRQPRPQLVDMAANTRPGVPQNMRMGVRSMHPRVPSFVGNRQLRPQRGLLPPASAHTPVRLPGGGQQDPIVIDLDADSPERPDADLNISERPETSLQTPVSTTGNQNFEIQWSSSQNITQCHENKNIFHGEISSTYRDTTFQGQSSMSANENAIFQGHSLTPTKEHIAFNQSKSTNYGLSIPANVSSNHQRDINSNTESLSRGLPNYSNEFVAENNSQEDTCLNEDRVHVPHSYDYMSTSVSSILEDVDTTEKVTQDSNMSSSINISSTESGSGNKSFSIASAPVAKETPIKSSLAYPQGIEHISNRSDNVPQSLSASYPAVSSIPPTNSHLNTLSTRDGFDEEEKVNAVVLEKVFAKVPNMPKNLSRRLVIKFKEYANGKGVKITPDSKVIDEFVSKIYYKGSATNRNTNIAQSVPDSSISQPSQVFENQLLVNSTQVLSAISESNSAARLEDPAKCDPTRKFNEINSVEVEHEELVRKEKDQVDENKVVNKYNIDQANDVVATHVILAETKIQFSKTFASLAQRLSSSNRSEKLQDRHEMDQSTVLPATAFSSFQRNPILIPKRRKSGDGNHPRKRTFPLRRSGSLPLNMSGVSSSSETVQKPEDEVADDQNSTLFSSGSIDSVSRNINQNSQMTSTFPVGPKSDQTATDTIAKQNSPLADIDQCKKEDAEINFPPVFESDISFPVLLKSDVSFPPVPESDISPILITSSIEDVVAKHPALEVDIAGKPLKHEEYNQTQEDDSRNAIKDVQQGESSNPEPLKKKKKYGLISGDYSKILDKATGKLLFKKSKRGRPRKLFKESKEKEDEITSYKDDDINENTSEDHAVRRSSRSRKPVNKTFQGDVNEIDELLSDDDDEYNIDDDDYDSESDNEWNGGSSEPSRKRNKKTPLPPDPTAFDASTKGRYRCWQCRKVFSKCSNAKNHIIRKHEVTGLCVINMDKSEENKAPCFLLFCFRNCKYSTLSFDGIKNHIEICTAKPIQDAEKFLENSKGFLESKFLELQNMSLDDILKKPKKEPRPKDPAKVTKTKKPKGIKDKPTSAPVIIPHVGASVPTQVNSAIISPVLPPSTSKQTTSGISFSGLHKKSLTGASSMTSRHMQPAMGSVMHPTTPKASSSNDLERPGLIKTHIYPAPKPNQHINLQLAGHHSTDGASAVSNRPYINLASRPPLSTNQPKKQPFTITGYPQYPTSNPHTQYPSSNPLTQYSARPPSPIASTPEAQDDIVYMIEDNGTICL